MGSLVPLSVFTQGEHATEETDMPKGMKAANVNDPNRIVDFDRPEERDTFKNQAEWLERRRRLGPLGQAMRVALVKAG